MVTPETEDSEMFLLFQLFFYQSRDELPVLRRYFHEPDTHSAVCGLAVNVNVTTPSLLTSHWYRSVSGRFDDNLEFFAEIGLLRIFNEYSAFTDVPCFSFYGASGCLHNNRPLYPDPSMATSFTGHFGAPFYLGTQSRYRTSKAEFLCAGKSERKMWTNQCRQKPLCILTETANCWKAEKPPLINTKNHHFGLNRLAYRGVCWA